MLPATIELMAKDFDRIVAVINKECDTEQETLLDIQWTHPDKTSFNAKLERPDGSQFKAHYGFDFTINAYRHYNNFVDKTCLDSEGELFDRNSNYQEYGSAL